MTTLTARPERKTLLVATPAQMQAVTRLAQQRTAGHEHCRTAQQNCGSAGNVRNDLFGTLAEWLVIDHMERAGMEPDGYELLTNRVKVGPDFTLGGVTFDIKAVPFGSRYLSCNERQRLDPRHACDYLLPVVFVGNNAAQVCQPIPYHAVADWELRQGHSPYRSIPVSVLEPLPDLRALLIMEAAAEGGPEC